MTRSFPARTRTALLACAALAVAASPAHALEWSTPQKVSPDGVAANPMGVIVADDGSATAFYGADTGGGNRIGAATRPAGSTTWGDPAPISPVGADISFFADAVSGPDGAVTVIWRLTGGDEVQVATRPAGSATFGAPETVLTGRDPRLAVRPDGSLVAVAAAPGHGSVLAAVRGPAAGSAWSAPQTVLSESSDLLYNPETVSDTAGNVHVVALRTGGASGVVATDLPSGSESWSAPQTVDAAPIEEEGNIVDLIAEPDGDVSAVWQIDLTPTKGPDRIHMASRSAGSEAWSAPVDATGSDANAFYPRLLADRTGAFSAFWTAYPMAPGAADRQPGGTFTPAASPTYPGYAAYPAPFLTAGGTTALVAITTVNMTDVDLTATERSGGAWSAPQTIGTGVRMQSGLPATGGNRFGAIAATWTQVGHQAVYATETPGDYTPPQPPQPQPDPAPAPETPPATGDQPPKTPAVLAPLPEARLAGRTIRIDARVTVKAKKRCKGTASARVKVGKRTFRGRLKLKTKAGACRATGTVRLAAAPAKKAKLRVTITAKVAKTRTLNVTR